MFEIDIDDANKIKPIVFSTDYDKYKVLWKNSVLSYKRTWSYGHAVNNCY